MLRAHAGLAGPLRCPQALRGRAASCHCVRGARISPNGAGEVAAQAACPWPRPPGGRPGVNNTND
eukprot:14056917-Alexandrium_andersonii.AAC.1